MAAKRLQKELQDIRKDPPPNCDARPIEGDLFNWEGTIKGLYII